MTSHTKAMEECIRQSQARADEESFSEQCAILAMIMTHFKEDSSSMLILGDVCVTVKLNLTLFYRVSAVFFNSVTCCLYLILDVFNLLLHIYVHYVNINFSFTFMYSYKDASILLCSTVDHRFLL